MRYGIIEIISELPCNDNVKRIKHEHHEREDGSSYPNQLTSNELSTLSKIVIVADVISAMFEDRPYRKRLNKQAVISELINGRDTLCDSNSVDVVFQSDLLMPLCRCQMIIR